MCHGPWPRWREEVLGLDLAPEFPSPDPLWGGALELLYIKFTSRDQTLILTLVLTGKLEFLGFSQDSNRKI